ncbi:type IV pilus modification PilV family protein [Pirellulimonas nuda]|uniref:type IV pilus modification PilV family protein n=1 Tax=Pirellulimonas nuda TaxID=2528009 RepID=UPI0011A06023|nr:hypothetical protein [Pirellulimonas nuda]
MVEVLISMGILALGLLGVAAIFPVGGHYVQAGDTYDSADAVAQAALADAAARGWLNPSNWVACERGDSTLSRPTSGATPLPAGQIATKWRTRFALPFDYGLQIDLARGLTPAQLNHLNGSAYVIDPLAVANAALFSGTNMSSNIQASNIPITARGAGFSSAAWAPWTTSVLTWPVHRMSIATLDNDNTAPFFEYYPLGKRQAESICISSDDLALEVPDDPARPIQQRLSVFGGVAVQRQSKGEFSWMLSVAPSSNVERNALALDPTAFDYEVSAVVFRGRQLGDVSLLRASERVVSARVISRGVGGGELLLERTPTSVSGEPAEDPFLQLRKGQYVMLVGPRPGSTPAAPAVFLAWYRVTAVEVPSNTPIGGLTPNPLTQRIVSLRGPDWPWFPGAVLDLTNTNQLSNDLRVGIFPGVVGVHTRTMRLTSGTAWGD